MTAVRGGVRLGRRPAPCSLPARAPWHLLTDRMLGCGTLVLSTASVPPLSLPDMSHVERVHVIMTELLFGDRAAVPPARDPRG